MAPGKNEQLYEEMKKAVDEVDKGYLRKMQAEMHRCAAVCYSDSKSSMERVGQCVMDCSGKTRAAEAFFQKELNDFHTRLVDCNRACHNKVKDEIGVNLSESDAPEFRARLEQCSEACTEEQIKFIAPLLRRIKHVFSTGDFQQNMM